MPSLTHVCMFYKRSWKRVTPEEAAEIFPETVSAHGGLFMCELCGQYVSLTKEGKKIRHFRHRSREADKSCPERTFGSEQSIDFLERTHSFPIRIDPSNLAGDWAIESATLHAGVIRGPKDQNWPSSGVRTQLYLHSAGAIAGK